MVTNLRKQLKKQLKIIIAITIPVGIVAMCIIHWNIVKFYRLQYPLQDVYFMEYGDDGTTIHKYDVSQRKTSTVGFIEGGNYFDCKINRSEDYIIGIFRHKREYDSILMRYNLSDDTLEEITGKEAEIMEERIKEAENKIPEWSSLPEEVQEIGTYWNNSWSADGEKIAFGDTRWKNIYLYDVNTETFECVLNTGLSRNFESALGLDASGKYLFYQDNFNYLFQPIDVKIMIYDIQTGMRTKIYERKYTRNLFEFVQEMN